MFLVPQPPSGGELVDGCAVVHLSDSAIDVTYVLEALCKRRHVTFNEPLPISVIAAFVRLGQKYQIDAVLSEALRRLYYEFPVDLSQLDEIHTNAVNGTAIIIKKNSVYIDVANLALEQNLLSVLPLALQHCSTARSHTIVKGVKREDHTVATLSPINKEAVLAASCSLLRLQALTTFCWLYPPVTACQTPEDCEHGRNQMTKTLFYPVPVYSGLVRWCEDWENDVCDSCVVRGRNLHHNGRRLYWDKLPSIFGLPEWEELKKERISSMTCNPTYAFWQYE
ncbi:hypothetical protein FIBSPDRAFT_927094 [Athelia psychrophila]|uniref:Uncharacterized protein n=1 Tax=Athelia psychrophila TaxID=1759441 RepID=A0A166SDT3_9AGAM|nr:hypothetical protein FIBSPDRAFT_927094 [Fibularhizoctonia sp. CBS 109695]